ncbi:MAG TPA: PD-(D/E)XK nuclease family protein [Elusimicrobiota bacterium]|nr:PD-(D/E)XK nuclease family protein [Elusimicrobiota bacterium]
MKASFSKVSSFYFCPKKYEYRYVMELPVPTKAELVFGTALHAALEANFAQKIETRRDLPVEELLEVFRKELSEGLEKVPEESLRGPSDVHYLRGMGEHFLSRFMAERAPALQPAPRGVECFFLLPLPGGHEISGKFDLMDTDWVLHDFKTSNKPYDRRRADKTQLVLYAWACERMFGRFPTALCFDVFVKGDGGEGAMDMQEPILFPVPSPGEMSQVAQRLQRQIEKILEVQEKNAFTRAFVPLRCKWCEYQTVCTADWEKEGKPEPARVRMDYLV